MLSLWHSLFSSVLKQGTAVSSEVHMHLFLPSRTWRMPETLHITITALLISPYNPQPVRGLTINKLEMAKLLAGAHSLQLIT